MSKVGIIMGSKSDYPVMKEAEDILKEFDIDYEIEIVSAHRTPDKMMDYSKNAHKRGINVIIAGAGGAAHLPGMVASNSSSTGNMCSVLARLSLVQPSSRQICSSSF